MRVAVKKVVVVVVGYVSRLMNENVSGPYLDSCP